MAIKWVCVEAIDSIVYSKGSDSSSDWQIISGSMIANNEGWARSMSLRTLLVGVKNMWCNWKFLFNFKEFANDNTFYVISKSLQMITPQDFLVASKICQKIFQNFFRSCWKSKTDRDLFKYLNLLLD